MRLGDPAAQVAVETIPTGSLSLDLALGLGWSSKGRIVRDLRTRVKVVRQQSHYI